MMICPQVVADTDRPLSDRVATGKSPFQIKNDVLDYWHGC